MRNRNPIRPLHVSSVVVAAFVAFVSGEAPAATTVGDLVRVRGMRSNHLVGLGLVVGLGGTGDQTSATREAVRRFSASCGFSAGVAGFDSANSALVAVTADLPPFLHAGQRVDVTVSACGDAKSLAGGTLVTTPLWAGSPEKSYVRAQGPVSADGRGRGERGATVGRVRLGGIVEREAPPVVVEELTKGLAAGRITLDLRCPSPQAASATADAITRAFPEEAKVDVPSPGEVVVMLEGPARKAPMRFLSDMLRTTVEFDQPPVIAVNERSGTVAAPGRIEIAPAAVSTEELFVTIGGARAGAPAAPAGKHPLVSVDEGIELQELVRELQRMQVSPRDLIAVLDGLIKVGALRAEIVVE